MNQNILKEIIGIADYPIINTHSHHLPDDEIKGMNLTKLLSNSYVNWCGKPIPDGRLKSEITSWLNAVRTRSYFVWLEKAMMDLYSIDKPLSADTWGAYDNAIMNAHKDTHWHYDILQNKCKYETIFLDAYWKPGDDNGHKEMFKPAYRINSLFYGYNRSAKDHNGNNIQVTQGVDIDTITEYIDFIYQLLKSKKQSGCMTLKCALAYDRELLFERGNKTKAQAAMQKNPADHEVSAFQNFLFDTICEIAAELSMPVQIHTGLGLMDGSNAMQLKSLIAANPSTTFWLMHGSYPWTADIAGLAHLYSNVWADLCWLPLIFPTAAHRLINELIDVCNSDRVVWGCDTWTGEESYGARMAFIEVLCKVLHERVEAKLMYESDAIRYAKAVLYDNAAKWLTST